MELYQLLELERNLSPKDYWEQKWEEVSKKLLLKNNELEIIKGMIRCADATTVSLPAEILQQIMEEWDKVIYDAEQVKKNYTRVSLCLGFSVGMVLCISVL